MLLFKLIREKFSNTIRTWQRHGLSQEALFAYFHKLPNQIQVEWKRDGKFIIGKVKADDNEFMTQAETAEEFVDMVNDALFAMYEIPVEYFRPLEPRKFKPNQEEFNKLNDAAIKNSRMSIQKGMATA